MELSDFRDDILNLAKARASVDGVFTSDAFVAEAKNLLEAAEELDNVDLLSYSGVGRRRQVLAVHGYQIDETDNSISLVVSNFQGGEEVPSITYTEATASLRSLEHYLKEALSGDFLADREPSTPEYQLAQTLKERHKGTGANAVSRFRLYLVTDARLSARAKTLDSSEVAGVPVEFHIWDVHRFFQVHESGRGREPLELDLAQLSEGIPALQVAQDGADTITYLAAVPGALLASMYRDHGSRLLEGNVRSFLTTRGKINKGIQETIRAEPHHFLAYNNGISATASDVVFEQGMIRRITDLQIVNGGQTTASLYYATQASRAVNLEYVSVQMKLVVVSPEDAQEMVPRISRYANSQNAVREDDFFSNSPFHVRMEELSKSVLAPATPGVNFQTKWYYERTRGQYLNERNRRSAAAQRTFAAEFPRSQVITKTDAAKYVACWDCLPHVVSAGAQKNFKAFASLVADRYAKQPEAFDGNYYRRLVAKAILYTSVRSAISKAEWYEAGYLANLTAFAIAKLSYEVSKNPSTADFDLMRIWQDQSVGSPILTEAVKLAKLALQVLTDSQRPVVNVTEWAKREAAWRNLEGLPHTLSHEFVRECLPVKRNSMGYVALSVSKRFPADRTEREHVSAIEAESWTSIARHLSEKALLTGQESQLIRQITSSPSRMLDIEVARSLLNLYVKAINEGWVDPHSS